MAISTKIDCVKRLAENDVSCFSKAFSNDLLESIRNWVKLRNTMMHDLLSLETYQDMDTQFKKSAELGKELLDELYAACTVFRSKYFAEGYEFVFPEAAMEGCICKPKKT